MTTSIYYKIPLQHNRCIHTYMHICILACIHAYLHTHTCIRPYTHIASRRDAHGQMPIVVSSEIRFRRFGSPSWLVGFGREISRLIAVRSLDLCDATSLRQLRSRIILSYMRLLFPTCPCQPLMFIHCS